MTHNIPKKQYNNMQKRKKKIRSVHTDRKKGRWILRSVKKMRPKLMTRIRKDLSAGPCFSKSYDLEQCKPYLDQSIDDRSKCLATKKLSYGLLNAISKSNYATTSNRRRLARFVLINTQYLILL